MKQIAEELDMSVGKVQYRWNKYRKEHDNFFQPNKNETFDIEAFQKQLKEERDQWSIDCNYGLDRCVLMAQSPATLFAYWDITKMTVQMVENQHNCNWNDLQKTIRLYDITAVDFQGNNANRYVDFGFVDCNQWFFYNLIPNRTYCIDLGVSTYDGFFSILRSNAVDTPRRTQEQTGLHTEALMNWKEGKMEHPQWLEGFSSYSYYEKLK